MDSYVHQRILLVTNSYCNEEGIQSSTSLQLERITDIVNQTKTQTLALNLFSHCTRTLGPFSSQSFFDRCPSLETLSLETGDLWEELDNLHLEIHRREQQSPIKFRRHFACGSDPIKHKQNFIEECRTGKRNIDGVSWLYCGEVNILRYSRKEKALIDEFGYMDTLKDSHTIMVPFHTGSKRWEIPFKQKHISQGSRLVISYWNKMDRRERRDPWHAFYDGQDCSKLIEEIRDETLNDVRIRIGFLNSARLH